MAEENQVEPQQITKEPQRATTKELQQVTKEPQWIKCTTNLIIFGKDRKLFKN